MKIVRIGFVFKWCFLFCFFCFTSSINGQQTINGFITNEAEEPLIGVNIFEKEFPSKGVSSEIDGSFQIDVSSNDALLVFTYIGFETNEFQLEGKTSVSIILKTNAQLLKEVVVTGLGIKRDKAEIGYSLDRFDGEELERANASNIVSALSGKSAGVLVGNGNGVDGGTTRITIRGNNNIKGNNQPLIIVDGVPIENDPGLQNIGRGQDWGSAINNINPADIAEYTILKGPTASAKYGSRGSNGVILITTKRGKPQKGLGVSYGLQHKITQPFRYRDVQNKYGAGGPITFLEPSFQRNEEGELMYPSNVYSQDGPNGVASTATFGFYGSGVSWGPKMEGQLVRWWDGELRPFSPQPDNLSYYFNPGHSTTHNLAFSGGNDFGNVRVSMSRVDNKAIVPNSKFDQSTISLGSNLKVSEKITADISMSYINFNRLNTPTLGDANDSYGKGITYSFPRSYKGLERTSVFNMDGSQNNFGGTYPFLYIGDDLWWNTYKNNTYLRRNKFIGAISLNYQITDWLSALGRIGSDMTFNNFETRNDPIDALGIQDGFYKTELAQDRVINNDLVITANKEALFNSKLSGSFSFGGTQWSRSQYGLRLSSNEWINPWLFALNNSQNATLLGNLSGDDVPEYRFDKKINSLYSFLNLSYDSYLFLEMSLRRDWSSSLPLNNNNYMYPGASLSFLLTEAFDLNLPWLNYAKFRGAYAQTATDTDPFLVDFIYETGNFGGQQTATLPNTIPPIGLKPQQANSYELGANIAAFDNRVELDFTYYYIRSYDQILESPVPSSSGASTIRINSGVLENKGIEAQLDINVFQNRSFYMKTGLNFARNRNKVVSLGDGAKTLILDEIWGLNGPAIAVQEGDDYGTIIGYDYIRHENGQPILNEDGTHYLFTNDRVPVGNASPDFIGGWTTQTGYKGFTVNTLIDTKWGGDVYSGTYVTGLQNGQSPSTLIERDGGGLPYEDPEGNIRNVGVLLDGVFENGQKNDKVVHYLYKYIPNAGGWGRWLSTPGVVENTWVKMREISVSYEVPENLVAKTKIFQNLTVALVGRDLFYIYTTLPDRINPEGSNSSGNAQGLEWASFPGVRSFGFNINASF